ncbi:MAG TPA: Uma2 family endonuclease [Gemmatimonadaceae bacterium]|jgi:Uma2 family endonuclease
MRPDSVADHPLSVSEYIAWEEGNTVKHEYVAGEVYAMTGVSARHNLIMLNLAMALRGRTRGRGCRVFATDVKLRASSDRYYYPDLMVACGSAGEIALIVSEPSLVVEVTSPSTRGTDRREKLEAYMKMPSLRAYLIVDQRRRHVLMYTRRGAADWTREEVSGNDELSLSFLNTTLSLDEIYEDITLPPLAVGEDVDPDEWGDEEELDDF